MNGKAFLLVIVIVTSFIMTMAAAMLNDLGLLALTVCVGIFGVIGIFKESIPVTFLALLSLVGAIVIFWTKYLIF